ncbi:MAG: DUF1704 domain-containing protein [Candidatus Paceibacterota bacterium]
MSALDEIWFEKFKAVGIFDDITFLKTDNKNYQEQRTLFLSGQIEQPKFIYQLPIERLATYRLGLTQLRTEIETTEKNATVRSIYLAKIDYQLLKLDLLKSVHEADDTQFGSLSKRLYGVPSKAEAVMALGTIIKIAEEHNFSLGPIISGLQRTLSVTALDGSSDFTLAKPTGKKINATEIKVVFEKRLKDLEIDWKVEIDDSVVSIVVSYEKGSICIPENRSDFESVIVGLLEHEIGVHVTRYVRGLASNLKLLAVGFPNYLESDEGLAAYYELQKNQTHIPGLSRYVAIALASGLLDNKQWNFREIYGFFIEYFTFLSQVTGRPSSQTDIQDIAWLRSFRVFRGVSSVTSGTCAYRDLAYWRGYLKMSKIIKAGHFTKEQLLLGKYDPTNDENLSILRELNILNI